MKSFEPSGTKPMSQNEFEMALHAAPIMVKNRKMNHHENIIWNVIDLYVDKNYKELKENSDRVWLIEWRDNNCPHARVDDLFKKRLPQIKQELVLAQALPFYENKKEGISQAINIIDTIGKQTTISDKRILLETALSTSVMVLNPTLEKTQNYKLLIEKLEVAYPFLIILIGKIKQFFGYVCFQPSWIEKANQAGHKVADRRELQESMKKQIHELKHDSKPEESQPQVEENPDIRRLN